MYIYYVFIVAASVLFSAEFALKKKYQTLSGTDIHATFLYNALSPIAFIVIMLAMEKGRMEFTWFEGIMSVLWALVFTAITYFSLKAFSLGSLSNYSLFLLGGGMVLPILYGAIFGGRFDCHYFIKNRIRITSRRRGVGNPSSACYSSSL